MSKQVAIHNMLVEARYSLTDVEGRIFFELLKEIKRGDFKFTAVTRTRKEWAESVGLATKNYRHFDRVIENLFNKRLSVKTKEGYDDLRWIQRKRAGTDTCCISLASDLIPYLLQLCQEYTLVEIAELISLKPHARRLYMLSKQYLNLGQREISIKELWEMLNPDKPDYSFKIFNRNILKPAEREINQKSYLSVKFIPNKSDRSRKGQYNTLIFDVSYKDGSKPKYRRKLAYSQPYTNKTLQDGTFICSNEGFEKVS